MIAAKHTPGRDRREPEEGRQPESEQRDQAKSQTQEARFDRRWRQPADKQGREQLNEDLLGTESNQHAERAGREPEQQELGHEDAAYVAPRGAETAQQCRCIEVPGRVAPCAQRYRNAREHDRGKR